MFVWKEGWLCVCVDGGMEGGMEGGMKGLLCVCLFVWKEGWKEGGIEDISGWEMASELIGF